MVWLFLVVYSVCILITYLFYYWRVILKQETHVADSSFWKKVFQIVFVFWHLASLVLLGSLACKLLGVAGNGLILYTIMFWSFQELMALVLLVTLKPKIIFRI